MRGPLLSLDVDDVLFLPHQKRGELRNLLAVTHEARSTWRITGMARAIVAAKYLGRTLNVARSFRPMKPEERESIAVERLKAVKARRGESLEALSRRSGNGWDNQTTAVYNGLFVNHTFDGGESVKIVRREHYEPPKRGDGESR